MDNKIIKGFWIGKELTNIQKLCIRSFQDNGHEFHLYSFDRVNDVPSGTVEMDANRIVQSRTRDFFQSDANFSDFFRSELTYYLGGWYVDMDIVCLRPFTFEQPRVFVSEYQFHDVNPRATTPLVNGCILKIPARDPMTDAILKRIAEIDTRTCGWIDVGPAQYRWGVDHFNYRDSIQEPDVFDSLWPTNLGSFVYDDGCPDWYFSDKATAIHLRTSYWRSGSKLDPNGRFNPNSMFEILKRKHGVK